MRLATRVAAVLACVCAGCLDTKPDKPSSAALSVLDAGAGSDKPPLALSTRGAAGASGAAAGQASSAVAAHAGSFAAQSGAPTLQPSAAGTPPRASKAGSGGSSGAAGSPEIPRAPAPTRAGDLVITELMIDPKALPDAEGEWFELYNASTTELSLRDCKLDDGVETLHAFPESLLLRPSEYATFARTAHPGFMPSATIALSLTNSADTLAITCAGVEIDRVSYDKAAGFVIKPGVTLSLDPDALSAQQNDDASAWCAGRDLYNDDFGTPGRANPSCHEQPAEPEEELDAGADAAGEG